MLSNLIHKALWKITEKFPERTRIIQVDGSDYLRRFYITPRRLDENGEETGKNLGFGVYLHYFYRGDEDRELHNHPWEKSVSLILLGGYFEERRTKEDEVVLKNIKPIWHWPFRPNYITCDDFHRVIKKQESPHVWTLFITGNRAQGWGFWDRETKKYIDHEDFVEKSEQGYKDKK